MNIALSKVLSIVHWTRMNADLRPAPVFVGLHGLCSLCVSIDTLRIGGREKGAFHTLRDVEHSESYPAHCHSLEKGLLSRTAWKENLPTLGKQSFSQLCAE